MGQNHNPPTPAAPAAPAPPKPHSLVFVLNTTRGPRTLMAIEREDPDDPKSLAIACDSKILGPGFNVIEPRWIADAKVRDMPVEFGLRVIDPTDMDPIDAIVQIEKTASRQALIEWAKFESRPAVKKKLAERMATRGPKPGSTDEN